MTAELELDRQRLAHLKESQEEWVKSGGMNEKPKEKKWSSPREFVTYLYSSIGKEIPEEGLKELEELEKRVATCQ